LARFRVHDSASIHRPAAAPFLDYLISYGKVGQPGGSGDAADISNQLADDEARAEDDRAKR
jgi:hypothetical protein